MSRRVEWNLGFFQSPKFLNANKLWERGKFLARERIARFICHGTVSFFVMLVLIRFASIAISRNMPVGAT